MKAPDKCQKCGAAFQETQALVAVYECGTECFTSDGRLYFRSIECTERVLIQRDALAERVKRLEEAGDAIVENGSVSESLHAAWNAAKEDKP